MTVNTKPHLHSIVICANMIVRKDDKFLFIKRSEQKKFAPGFVHPIGGKVDKDEDPLVAAERELLEEAGLSVKNIKLEAVVTEITPPPHFEENRQIFHFSGEYSGGSIIPCDEGEFIRLTKEEVKQQKLFPSVGEIIDHMLDDQVGTIFASFVYRENQECKKMHFSLCKS